MAYRKNLVGSVKGKYKPGIGEVAVYWKNLDYSDIFLECDFNEEDFAREIALGEVTVFKN